MSGHEHGDPSLAELTQHAVDQREPGRIEMAVRFVQHHDARPLLEDARDRQALAHAGGEGLDRVVAAGGRPDFLQAGQQRLASWVATEEARGDREVLERGERLVEVRAMAEQRDALAGPLSLSLDLQTEDAYRSRVRADRRGQD